MPAERIKIGSNWWRISRSCRSRDDYGDCDFEDRTIRIHKNLSDREAFGTIIHECVHAAAPDLTEEAVERIEYAIMQGLRWANYIPSEDE